MKKNVKQIKKNMTTMGWGVCLNNAIVLNACSAAHAIVWLRTRICRFMVICLFLCMAIYRFDAESQREFVGEELERDLVFRSYVCVFSMGIDR